MGFLLPTRVFFALITLVRRRCASFTGAHLLGFIFSQIASPVFSQKIFIFTIFFRWARHNDFLYSIIPYLFEIPMDISFFSRYNIANDLPNGGMIHGIFQQETGGRESASPQP